jgi:hypothetical protein
VDGVRGRAWAWAAFAAAAVLLLLFLPTWGFSLLLAPVALALTVVAWFRARHDGVFWSGVLLTGLLLLGFAAKVKELG